MIEILKKIFPKDPKAILLMIVLLVVVFLIGFFSGGSPDGNSMHNHSESVTESTIWTCSMHPQIQQPGPGQCPICGMDLIPVMSDNSEKLSYRQIKLSEAAQKLAQVQTMPVEKKFVSTEIRMVGKIEFDETRIKYITAWVPGRIDRMFVDYTGTLVRKGDHLVDLYSPELLSTQQELIQSVRSANESGSNMLKQNVKAIKDRLRLWGLTENQISKIESSGKESDHVTIYAPMSGIVIEKQGLQGMYVNTGSRIYTIADLSQVWVKLDAYEFDVPWIRYGQEVEFETETYPGEKFTGRIAFIDPVLNEQTRTVKVRVNVKNNDRKLKPGMFVRAVVKSNIAAGGKVMDPTLVGKWISPMHPEIVKNKPGKCDVCGMDLVRAEELGYVSAENKKNEASLVIPASAPLITGKRAVVYVQVPNKEGVFEAREITLGPRTGDYYIVLVGLSEGELVVVNGNFKIDSAIQILAKPSMMNPDGSGNVGHQHGNMEQATKSDSETENNNDSNVEAFANLSKEFKNQLNSVYNSYFNLQFEFSHDNFDAVKNQSNEFIKSLQMVDMSLLKGEAHQAWMKQLNMMQSALNSIQNAQDLEKARTFFETLSNALILTTKKFGGDGSQNIYLYHCPMAFNNKGADWLQNKQGTENPYYGSKMFSCGSEKEVLVNKQ